MGVGIVNSTEIAEFAVALQEIRDDVTNAELIDTISALEDMKSAACAAQAVISAQFESAVREERRQRGTPADRWSKGISAQIALARKESPHRGGHLLGQARILTEDMPHTLNLLRTGHLNEWRTSLIIKEIICLDRDDRRHIDEQLCADPETLRGLGDTAVRGKAYTLAVERDCAAIVERARKAPNQRCVTSRPAPDSMAYLTALLPMKDAVAVHATLSRDADTIICTEDVVERSKNQIMADLLLERCTGVSAASASPVEVVIVISDESLLAGGTAPAHVKGYGPIPAAIARDIIAHSVTSEAVTTLRKLYSTPVTGAITAMESTARAFPKSLARLIDLRDRWCRTPYCNAPIRHHDHITPHHAGGPTSAHNGAGLCEACNYTKETPGWSSRSDNPPGTLHSFELITPTGHRYRSTADRTPTPLHLNREAS
ncbi:HNH endonuclease [Rhodococcoides yunnanense]|uniref:HNH endonuclease n=1 Tax=Rhodococcoides yunnanense TaxID=278209 RepID=UPI000932CD7C|nr:HNH endonuclease signature motif containing protein [Rhodococcus yunnanensis]